MASLSSVLSTDLFSVSTSSKDYSSSHSPSFPPAEPSPPQDIPGFPTYAQYKRAEAAYLTQFTSAPRQDKALIPQPLFDRVWDELALPGASAEDSKFRSWVRNTFALGAPPFFLGTSGDAKLALLHRKSGLPVAVREQIYALLCYFHDEMKHGTRENTVRHVYAHFRYVPRKLILEFLKMCPTCAPKNRGRPSTYMKSIFTADQNNLVLDNNKENLQSDSDPCLPAHTSISTSDLQTNHDEMGHQRVFSTPESLVSSPPCSLNTSAHETHFPACNAAPHGRRCVPSVSEFPASPRSTSASSSPLSLSPPEHTQCQDPADPARPRPAATESTESASTSPQPAWDDFFIFDDVNCSDSHDGTSAPLSPHRSPPRSPCRAHPYKVSGVYSGRARYQPD